MASQEAPEPASRPSRSVPFLRLRMLLTLRALRIPLALLLVAAVLRLLQPDAIQPWVWGPLLALSAAAWLWDARSQDAGAHFAPHEGEETDRAAS